MVSELEDSTLAIGTSRDHTDVGGVVDGSDDTGSQDNLLPVICFLRVRIPRSKSPNSKISLSLLHIPGLANVQDVDTVGTELPEVRLHVSLEVLGTQVALSRQEHLNVLGRRVEDRRKLRGGHDGRLIWSRGQRN